MSVGLRVRVESVEWEGILVSVLDPVTVELLVDVFETGVITGVDVPDV